MPEGCCGFVDRIPVMAMTITDYSNCVTFKLCYWLGTQFSMDAGVVTPPGDLAEFHQGTDLAQV
jgi:hypothetical protein